MVGIAVANRPLAQDTEIDRDRRAPKNGVGRRASSCLRGCVLEVDDAHDE